jgi:hypothetical protein
MIGKWFRLTSLSVLLGWAIFAGSVARAQSLSALPLFNPGGMTWVSVTCGTTSTPLGVSASQYLVVQVPSTASQVVFFGWGSAAATTTTASESSPAARRRSRLDTNDTSV